VGLGEEVPIFLPRVTNQISRYCLNATEYFVHMTLF
jgi:hypothetical protein